MKHGKTDRRKMRRRRIVFKTIEERDRFLAETFPALKFERAGIYQLEHGGKLRVWLHTVMWTEPQEQNEAPKA